MLLFMLFLKYFHYLCRVINKNDMNKRFRVCMHHNTEDELRAQGATEDQLKHFEFDTIKESLDFNYPYHKDNYIISQEDRNSPPDEYGVYPCLAEAYLWELDGTENDLKQFIEY